MESVSYVAGYYNVSQFRAAKYNRTTFALNVKIEYFIDLDENVFVEVLTFVSRMNNNQFEKSPLRIPKMMFCSYLKGPYKRYMMSGFKNTSNWPQAKEIEQ